MPLALTTVFAGVPGPRRGTADRVHKLTDILVIATPAVIAGAGGWEQTAACGCREETFFRRFPELPGDIPSHDAFNRVFAKLAPGAFAARFGRWMAQACETAGPRRHRRQERAAVPGGHVHRVPAPGRGLGRREPADPGPAVGARRGREIIAAPDLLAALGLAGALVTIGAAFCEQVVVAQSRERGGDYLVCAKGDQKGLHGAAAGVFERAGEAESIGCDMAAEVGAGHGRAEGR